MPSLAVVYLIVYAIILFYFRNKYIALARAAQSEAENNLGMPASLETAERRLYGDAPKNEFVIHALLLDKRHKEARQAEELKSGKALIAHPDYPDQALLVDARFLWGDDVAADGTTRYKVAKSYVNIPYLKKI